MDEEAFLACAPSLLGTDLPNKAPRRLPREEAGLPVARGGEEWSDSDRLDASLASAKAAVARCLELPSRERVDLGCLEGESWLDPENRTEDSGVAASAAE